MKAKEILNALRALEGREISIRPGMCWPGKCFLCTEVVQAVATENGKGIPVVTIRAESGDGWTFRACDIRKIGYKGRKTPRCGDKANDRAIVSPVAGIRTSPLCPHRVIPLDETGGRGEIEDQIVAWLVENVPADLLCRAAEEVAEPDFYEGWE